MKGKLKKILCLVLALILLLPVVAYATALTPARARTSARNLNVAIRNYQRQVNRIETLKANQIRLYSRLIARQETAEVRLISRQQNALSNAYARLDRVATNREGRRLYERHGQWLANVTAQGGRAAVLAAAETTSPAAFALRNVTNFDRLIDLPGVGVAAGYTSATDFIGELMVPFAELPGVLQITPSALDYRGIVTLETITPHRHSNPARWSDDLWDLLPWPRITRVR